MSLPGKDFYIEDYACGVIIKPGNVNLQFLAYFEHTQTHTPTHTHIYVYI